MFAGYAPRNSKVLARLGESEDRTVAILRASGVDLKGPPSFKTQFRVKVPYGLKRVMEFGLAGPSKMFQEFHTEVHHAFETLTLNHFLEGRTQAPQCDAPGQ